jgi:hypothetical protein
MFASPVECRPRERRGAFDAGGANRGMDMQRRREDIRRSDSQSSAGPDSQSGGMWYSMICFEVNPGICR